MKERLILTAVRTVLPSILGALGALFASTLPAYYQAVCGAAPLLPGVY